MVRHERLQEQDQLDPARRVRGELVAARGAGRLLVQVAPLRESGRSLLMRALAAEGNRAEALRANENLRLLLVDARLLPPNDPSQQLYATLVA